MSIPRSWRRSSTCRNDSGKRTYIMTAKRIISGEVLKYRNGLRISGDYETRFAGSSYFALTVPCRRLNWRNNSAYVRINVMQRLSCQRFRRQIGRLIHGNTITSCEQWRLCARLLLPTMIRPQGEYVLTRSDFRDYTSKLYEIISTNGQSRDWESECALYHPGSKLVRAGLNEDGSSR